MTVAVSSEAARSAGEPFDVGGRVVLVTGATSGLGAWIAEGLDAAGALVVATGRRADRLEELAARLQRCVVLPADLTDDDARAELVSTALDTHGRIDGLVNNAGVLRAVPALKETADDVRALLEINLVAPLDLARQCALAMRESGGGSIVNITSMSGIVATGLTVPSAGYCAAKAGLAHATRELAVQWGRHGVRVNAVAPGMFPTEMVDGLAEPPGFFADRLVLKRTGTPGDIVDAVRFLLSDAAAYVTGQQLAVDGGRTIT
ncbi:SDR family oxidoreductase [Pseudofrankia sp. BMG5.37]|uniref:SDR family NAD(P)-dependent oxidoreductase n=1 Tax=Pseudofrankia sp. BMG5.37 TaxID=3050035 RepID=UPI0028954AEE|nr:SDR family oxidoreductase [Pseudofrankia sp. BMG5.37]MDT3441871.1 SDR family oxidoreductase [Pseudofrankia sp. BMG5.37]